MPKAGFWAIGGYEISFRKDGNWYADEEVIANPRIARLFSQHVQPDGEGGWVVDIGIDRQPVVVEDTPLVVTAVDGDPEGGFRITTNDGAVRDLDAATLRTGAGNVLYCVVDCGDRGVLTVRFLRAPYYELARYVEDGGGAPSLTVCGTRYPLAANGD